MRIGIIGSGNVGGAPTHCLRALGHDVAVANSRGPAFLAALANETGARAVAIVLPWLVCKLKVLLCGASRFPMWETKGRCTQSPITERKRRQCESPGGR